MDQGTVEQVTEGKEGAGILVARNLKPAPKPQDQYQTRHQHQPVPTVKDWHATARGPPKLLLSGPLVLCLATNVRSCEPTRPQQELSRRRTPHAVLRLYNIPTSGPRHSLDISLSW